MIPFTVTMYLKRINLEKSCGLKSWVLELAFKNKHGDNYEENESFGTLKDALNRFTELSNQIDTTIEEGSNGEV